MHEHSLTNMYITDIKINNTKTPTRCYFFVVYLIFCVDSICLTHQVSTVLEKNKKENKFCLVYIVNGS